MISLLLFAIFTLFFVIRSGDLIYRFQIKEYRTDRFIGSIQDESIVYVFLTGKKLPAVTIRNILISCISTVLFIGLMGIIVNDLFLITLSIVLTPTIALIFVYSGVFITGIFSGIKRIILIEKAKQLLNHSRVTVIGITGSYGKTSTKEFLYTILSTTYKTAKTDENMNTVLGVALSIIKNLKSNTEYFIAEMGAYKRGEIDSICKFIQPQYGIITGIGNQHLVLFGSREHILKAKSELLEALPKKGTGIIATEKPPLFTSNPRIKAKLLFISPSENGNQTNLSLAVKLAQVLKVPPQNIHKVTKEIIKRMKPQPVRGLHGSSIIDHSYSSNVQGFLQHIKDISGVRGVQNKIIISRGIIELGYEKSRSYEQIVHELEKNNIELLTTDVTFKQSNSKNVRHFHTERHLITYLQVHADNKTVILIEGRFQPLTLNILFTGT